MEEQALKILFKTYKETTLFGRYIHSGHIAPLLDKASQKLRVAVVGYSVNNLPIHTITFGSGPKKILMWSQMHGNESTTTKAVFDFLNVILNLADAVVPILKECTICVIPMLNPDGAKSYTRFNAEGVDLNRDAQKLCQPESNVLFKVFKSFNPNFCYNLHGQRTIFGAGAIRSSAVMSFLAPAQDQERTITVTRQKAMEIIDVMNANLQKEIPNQVGIYDDAFNINCVGDTFQSLGVPTILFEAGHFISDYNREFVRGLVFKSLLVSLDYIAKTSITGGHYKGYFELPANRKCFYDIIIRNSTSGDIAIQYLELLKDGAVVFVPKVEKITNLSQFYGHKEMDAYGSDVLNIDNSILQVGNEIDFVTINGDKLSLKV